MINPKTVTSFEGDRVMLLKREFDAPQETVFRAWTEREHLMNWWGPPTWPLDYCTVDLRPGGIWHYRMRGPEGEESWGKTVYKTIEPHSGLSYTAYFSDKDAAELSPGMFTEVTFEAKESKTVVHVRTTFTSAEDMKNVMEMGQIEGMSMSLDRLDDVLAKAAA
ncbi:MAG: SRPBCC domain-containing protein [Dehalococcoidia bacterium]